MKIIFATGNEGKMREVRMILADLHAEILSSKEVGIAMDVEEDGTTFAENALIKARYAYQKGCEAGIADAIYMADDSGLEVDALNKEPGIYSARYMGEDTSYDIKNTNIIQRLDGVEDEKRTARFVSAIGAVLPDGSELVTEGTVEGRIGYEIKGAYGFGYDPIFYLPERGCTSAELLPEEKNAISHRGRSLEAMCKALAENKK